MRRTHFFPLLFCLSLILFPLAAEISGPGENAPWSASDIPNPTEAGTGYVTSIGGYLTDGETAGINDLVLGIERDTSVEIAVVVVPSLAEDIFTEAQALFDRWEIGKAGVDNGLLILAAIEDRNIRTHTGYGMEGLFTDAGISVLQESIIVPAFREGRYGDGLIAYVTEIDRIIRDPAAAAELRAAGNLLDQDRARTRTLRERFSNFGENAFPFFMFGGAGFLILIGAVVSFVKEFRAVLKNRRKNSRRIQVYKHSNEKDSVSRVSLCPSSSFRSARCFSQSVSRSAVFSKRGRLYLRVSFFRPPVCCFLSPGCAGAPLFAMALSGGGASLPEPVLNAAAK